MSDQSEDTKDSPEYLDGIRNIQQAAATLGNLGEVGKMVRDMAGQVGALRMGISPAIFENLPSLTALRQSLAIPAWAETFAKTHKEIAGSIGSAAAEFQRTMSPGFLKFSKEMAAFSKAIVEREKRQLEAFPALAERVPMLTQRGWFISSGFYMADFEALAEAAKCSTDDELELLVERLYRENLDMLADDLHQEFPSRKKIVEQAVHAHHEGWYALSIPVFFAQSDGVCMERTEKHLFMGRDNKNVRTYAQQRASELQSDIEGNEGQRLSAILQFLIWTPLTGEVPIRFTDEVRKERGYSGLNRHAVLHGESLDYATEINSLKSFSLLSYTASLLGHERISTS